jgi:hypothetical protein
LQTVTDKNCYLEYLVKTKQKKKQTPYLSPSLESVSKEIINKGNDPIILRSSYEEGLLPENLFDTLPHYIQSPVYLCGQVPWIFRREETSFAIYQNDTKKNEFPDLYVPTVLLTMIAIVTSGYRNYGGHIIVKKALFPALPI